MDLRRAWAADPELWIDFARSEVADPVFWHFNLPEFLDLLPPPGALTLDVGCGEGRVSRALAARGHRVVGVDAVEAFTRAATTHAASAVTYAWRWAIPSRAPGTSRGTTATAATSSTGPTSRSVV